MNQIFGNVPADSIDKFFFRMFLSERGMPHTSTRISPITFTDFMSRNNILCTNQLEVYDTANKEWKRFLNSFEGGRPKDFDRLIVEMDKSEEPRWGWCKVIDLMNRILDVSKFRDNYCQMHYLAHVCHLANIERFHENDEENIYHKTIFKNCISPIVYPIMIPTLRYTWTPIVSYTDVIFEESVTMMCTKVSDFISSHQASSANVDAIDRTRVLALGELCVAALKEIKTNKYNANWSGNLNSLLTSVALIASDLRMCELYDEMERDGCKCVRPIKKLSRIKKSFDANRYEDPNDVIDDLLDVYTILDDCLKCYNMGSMKELTDSKEKNNHA